MQCQIHGRLVASMTIYKRADSEAMLAEIIQRYENKYILLQLYVLGSQITDWPIWCFTEDADLRKWIEDSVFQLHKDFNI